MGIMSLVAGTQLLLYIPPLAQGTPQIFEYHLRARFPMRAATPPSRVYDYYNPSLRANLPPVDLEVR